MFQKIFQFHALLKPYVIEYSFKQFMPLFTAEIRLSKNLQLVRGDFNSKPNRQSIGGSIWFRAVVIV